MVRYLTDQSPSYRVTATKDPVPRQPGVVLGYMHTSPEYWITRNPDNPRASEINVLTGYYNDHGNSGTHWWFFKYHKHYFGPISSCGGKDYSEKRRRDIQVNNATIGATGYM